jgi:ABC-type sugar transport system ATPase subunit
MSGLLAELTVFRDGFVVKGKVEIERSGVILAKNGSGKTTFLKGIAGLLKAEGKVTLNGVDVTAVSPEKRGITYVPNDLKIPTTLERIAKLTKSDLSYLKDLGYELSHSKRLNSLSLGQRQVVLTLTAVTSTRSKAVLLDESVSNVTERDKVIKRVLEIANELNKPLVYATNIRSDVTHFEKVFTIYDGKVVEADHF